LRDRVRQIRQRLGELTRLPFTLASLLLQRARIGPRLGGREPLLFGSAELRSAFARFTCRAISFVLLCLVNRILK
jgi:hypothetical protein